MTACKKALRVPKPATTRQDLPKSNPENNLHLPVSLGTATADEPRVALAHHSDPAGVAFLSHESQKQPAKLIRSPSDHGSQSRVGWSRQERQHRLAIFPGGGLDLRPKELRLAQQGQHD